MPASFNPRARVGRDFIGLSAFESRARFNPRARVGRDTICVEQRLGHVVSIHAPAWGATEFRADKHGNHAVSIHAPAWGATWISCWACAGGKVSIHAPAWGATLKSVIGGPEKMFQSTRPRGARLGRFGVSESDLGFNPRARVGRDKKFRFFPAGGVVSIHAPAWGATRRGSSANCCLAKFQSTRPRGARLPLF